MRLLFLVWVAGPTFGGLSPRLLLSGSVEGTEHSILVKRSHTQGQRSLRIRWKTNVMEPHRKHTHTHTKKKKKGARKLTRKLDSKHRILTSAGWLSAGPLPAVAIDVLTSMGPRDLRGPTASIFGLLSFKAQVLSGTSRRCMSGLGCISEKK